MNVSLFRKLIIEFIGTFFLVYVIGCVSLQDHVLLGPLAIGASLMVMIFAGGHISGVHYNPAVTIGVAALGLASRANLWVYWLSEFVGAGVAALFFLVVNQEKPHEPSVASRDRAQEQTNPSIRVM